MGRALKPLTILWSLMPLLMGASLLFPLTAHAEIKTKAVTFLGKVLAFGGASEPCRIHLAPVSGQEDEWLIQIETVMHGENSKTDFIALPFVFNPQNHTYVEGGEGEGQDVLVSFTNKEGDPLDPNTMAGSRSRGHVDQFLRLEIRDFEALQIAMSSVILNPSMGSKQDRRTSKGVCFVSAVCHRYRRN
ncbi:MAG: hypothetical protein AAF203_04360, partial [Pseudomonadota bacterium]